MQWAIPQYSREQVDAAGQSLAERPFDSSLSMTEAYAIVSNWRSSHAFPLNTMQVYLRRKSRNIDSNSLVAQRVKRLSSIVSKLRRFGWLKFSEMQDVGGCRAIVGSVRDVERLVETYDRSDIKHALIDEDDYISHPKSSGYRGYHLIYGYNSDKKRTYNGHKIEIQIRSNLQHLWATAVETVGTFTRQTLKSSQGEEEWLRFFALMSSFLALREKRPTVPNTPQDPSDLVRELAFYAKRLNVISRLSIYGEALRAIEHRPIPRNVRYFLLDLDVTAKTITITGFPTSELNRAATAYLEIEQQAEVGTNRDAVLVSAESVDSLKGAYPNYFLDTTRFRRQVQLALRNVPR